MPTYEYVCHACAHEFEEFQSITAKPLRKCPSCAKLKLQRLIGTGAGIIFKGSGFYETDYRGEGYQKSAKAEAEAGKPAEGRKEAGTESTTDAKKSDSAAKDAAPANDAKPAATAPAKAASKPDAKSAAQPAPKSGKPAKLDRG